MRRRIVLHIGTHKSGTTSIQDAFARHAAQLTEHGVLYPCAGRPADGPTTGHHLLAWSVRRLHGHDGLDAWHALADEVRSSSCDRVVVSAEALADCSSDEASRAVSALGEFDVEALLVVRNELDFLVASYRQWIKVGIFSGSFREFMVTYLDTADYARMATAWEQVLDVDRVHVVGYDQVSVEPGLLAAVAEHVGLPPGVFDADTRANVSPDDDAVSAARYLNRVGARWPRTTRWVDARRADVVAGTSPVLGRALSRLGRTGTTPTSSDIAWLTAQIADQHRSFAERYLPASHISAFDHGADGRLFADRSGGFL